MRVKEFAQFVARREEIRTRKEVGLPRVRWTTDPILVKYRFCNVRREDDRVTKWIAENWREPYKDHPDLWFAMAFARLFNLPSTLESVGAGRLLNFQPERVRMILHEVRKQQPIFNGAYIVSTNGKSMDKVDYLIQYVLGPMWAARKSLRPFKGQALSDFHIHLMSFDGMGSFMAAQVVADMKYVEPLRSAPDWATFAASGPGSRRGLNRAYDYPVNDRWAEGAWRRFLAALQRETNKALKWEVPLHAQDIQNCLCEFDKYERVRLGEGVPKQLYKERG